MLYQYQFFALSINFHIIFEVLHLPYLAKYIQLDLLSKSFEAYTSLKPAFCPLQTLLKI